AGGGAGLDQLFGDERRVSAIPAVAAHRLGVGDAENACRSGLAMEVARHLSRALPVTQIRDDFPAGEIANRLAEQIMLQPPSHSCPGSGVGGVPGPPETPA